MTGMEYGREKTLESLKSAHTKEAIRERLRAGPPHSYLRDFIYGAIDGTVTTFAVVAGVEGASLAAGIVIILGFANLIGDGFSMAVSNFLGTRAEQQLRERYRRMEELHIATVPEGEREEIRQIFAGKGFSGQDLERAVTIITSDMTRWIDTMLQEELGVSIHGPSPWRAALSTFMAFFLVGLIPLIPFLIQMAWPGTFQNPFCVSIVITGAAFFTVGAFKSRFVGQRWFLAGMETLVAGGGAAVLAYFIGLLLKDLVHAL